MSYPTELRTYIDENEILDEDYVYSLYIKNLTRKEGKNMLEELKMQREEYAAEVERLKNVDLNAMINERFEALKEQATQEVVAEHEAELKAAELNVEHYDFVIRTMEAKATLEINEGDIVSDIEEVNEVPEGADVYDEVKIAEV